MTKYNSIEEILENCSIETENNFNKLLPKDLQNIIGDFIGLVFIFEINGKNIIHYTSCCKYETRFSCNKKYNMTKSMKKVLSFMSENERTYKNSSQISKNIQSISYSTVHNSLDKLHRMGYIYYIPTDKENQYNWDIIGHLNNFSGLFHQFHNI